MGNSQPDTFNNVIVDPKKVTLLGDFLEPTDSQYCRAVMDNNHMVYLNKTHCSQIRRYMESQQRNLMNNQK